MSSIIGISICADDIDQSKAYKHTNGKTYYALTVMVNDTVNDYGKDVSVSMEQSKEEREAKQRKHFCGNGATIWSSDGKTAKEKPAFNQQQQPPVNDAPQQQAPPIDDEPPF